MRVAAPRERLTGELQGLVEDNIGMARAVAVSIWRTAPSGLELDELIGLAYWGLVDAAARWHSYCAGKNFDPADYRAADYFTNYARMYVRGRMFDKIRQDDHASRGDRAKVRRLLEAGYGAGVSECEAADAVGLDRRDASRALAATGGAPLSLPSCPGPGEIDVGNPVDTEGAAGVAYLLAVVVTTVEGLSEEARQVLALHYYAGMELRALAAVLGLTESRASKLHTEAVMVVRDALRQAC